MILAALTALALGCKKEDDADRKDLDSRERVPLSVSYSADGAQVSSLTFPHGAMQKTIDVSVNNENLHWDVLSNRPWCKVVQAEHQGSGSITLEIEANESFEAREPATLTFVAGEYRGASLTVSQSGSAFVISHPYLIFPKEESPIEVDITTLADQEWRVENDEWINVEEISALTDEGKKTTTLKIWPVDNDQDSRYATITLSTDEDRDIIALYQFGSDLMYDGEGNIFFPSDEPASISFIAPEYVVREVVAPDYATAVGKQNSDGTITFSIDFDDNLSDCELIREIPVSIVLNNASSTTIALPSMRQDFLPAGGLMTAVGIKAFAAKVAEGGDLSSWQTDGVVRVLQDIDMDGVTDWAGIGSEEHPFSGVFDGEGHSIVNLRNSSAPIFNACEDASVKNFTVAKTCSFYFESATVGALANEVKGTTVERCTFAGTLEFAGTSDEPVVGGLVGIADETSTVNVCKMTGTLSLSSGSAADAECLAGGIAGLCKGALISCECTGTINCMCSLPTVNVGGMTSVLDDGATVLGNSFTGELIINGGSTNVAAGALYGHIRSGNWVFDSTSDLSLASGSIKIVNFAAAQDVSNVFAGGFVGLIGENVGLTAKGYTLMTNFYVDKKTNVQNGLYLNCGGFLGSCEPDYTAGEMLFENLENIGVIEVMFNSSVKNLVRRSCTGGIVGLVRGPAQFISCINRAELGKSETYCNNSTPNPRGNERTQILGGIAGQAYGGNISFTRCINEGKLCNGHYNNNGAWYATAPNNFVYGNFMAAPCTGGILGAFNYKQTPESKTVTIEDCSNTANIWAFRGYVGGIVGFAQKASISGCSWRGVSDGANSNQASFKGGIAGGLAASSVTNCSANVNLNAHKGGSAQAADAGGIVARVIVGDPVTVTSCSFYGDLSCSASGDSNFAGGMVSTVESNTVIRDCRIGGKVLGTTISDNTAASKAVGNGTCTVEGITLWNGI